MTHVLIKRFDSPDETRDIDLRAGDLFSIGPGHDSWVVGKEADEYAK